jgi:hypothetical protein
MAIFESAHGDAQRQAIQESFRKAARHDRFGALGRALARLVHGLFAELGRLLRVAMVAGIVGACAGFGLIMLGYSDPVVGLKHFAAAPHCAFAERLDIASARYGQPGYWKHHDADGNGVACEP